MTFIKTPVKGMRDFLPKEMAVREYVLSVMKDTYENFGFQLIGTPTVEHIENLTSKQGGENEKLIFKILKRGEKLDLENIQSENDLVDAGLRYDLTVPLARLYAGNMNNLPMPFRALQIGYSYRAERPQRGRYRELMQCDLDILGEKSNLAEIELISAVVTFLKRLNFKSFTVRINDRRILTRMIEVVGLPEEKQEDIFIALDKMDKIGIEGVREELLKLELDSTKVDAYLAFFANTTDFATFCEQIHLDNDVCIFMEQILDNVKKVQDVTLVFDPTLVRGMGYYTGPIFEIAADGLASSIGGGGRYDTMIEKFANVSVSAVGFSIGFERLLLLLQERDFRVPVVKEKKAFVFQNDEKLSELLCMVKDLREKGQIVKVVRKSKNFKFQRESLINEGYQVEEW